MRNLLSVAILLLSPALAIGAQAPQVAPKSAGTSCAVMSANFLRSMQDGAFDAATTHFDQKMKSALGPQRLRQIWRQTLPQQFGTLKHTGAPKSITEGTHSGIITPLEFAKGWLSMIVSCNDRGQIEGLFFRPSTAPTSARTQTPSSATSWIAAAAAGGRTLPITVQRKGFALRGVLDLPPGKGPFPVVDIIPGSGPVNINGNDHAGPGGGIAYSPYRKLAAALVRAGWAVARIAKRGLPPSSGDGNGIVFAGQVADNLTVLEALRKNPHVDAGRIVVAGHSIGGLIAPRLATETPLAGLILLEAPGESMRKILDAQALEMAQHAGASRTEIAAIKQSRKKLYTSIMQTPAGQALAFEGKSIPAWEVGLLKSWLAQRPLATARKVTIPTLVVQGGMDFNVPPGNGKRLVQALPHGKLLYIPQMGHALDIASCRCAKQLDTRKRAMLAPGLAAGIVRWLRTLKP